MDNLKNINNESLFKKLVQALVRELWMGNITIHDFYQQLKRIITQGYNAAWEEGQYDVGAGYFYPFYQHVVNAHISRAMSYGYGLAQFVEENSSATGGRLHVAQSRTWIWANGYNMMRNLARMQTGEDTKLIWVRHSKDGCFSCRALEGKIYTASEWAVEGVHPQSPKLACVQDAKGIPVCRCRLEVTDKLTDIIPLGQIIY